MQDRLFQALYQLPDFPDSLSANRARGRDFRERVIDLLVTNTFSREHILLTAGQREQTMYFLNKGYARGFSYNKENGKEDTTFIWNDLSFVASPESFYSQRPSNIYIQVAAGAEIVSATYTDMIEIFSEFQEGTILTRGLLMQYFEASLWRQHMLSSMNPRQRYQALLKRFPQIMLYFPAEIIASYLSITRETLSRVKNFVS